MIFLVLYLQIEVCNFDDDFGIELQIQELQTSCGSYRHGKEISEQEELMLC